MEVNLHQFAREWIGVEGLEFNLEAPYYQKSKIYNPFYYPKAAYVTLCLLCSLLNLNH